MRIRYRSLAYSVLVVALAACSGGSEPNPVATSIQLLPSATINLASIGATQQLQARVLDQNGDSMPGVPVAFAVTSGTAATVTPGGLVTAQANGTATITATAASATGSATVNVAQVPAQISKNAGDNQAGTVAAALANSIAARVVDALGNVIVNQTVNFAVATGGGQVNPASAQTNANGIATTTWTLGQSAGTQTATASTGTLAPITFFATANAGAASLITVNGGNNQTGATNTAVSTSPSVRVTDAFDNAKPGVSVTFAVTGGGGSISPSNGIVTTNAQGIATLTSWTLGSGPGPNSLSATITGTAVSTTFGATGVAPGAPTAVAAFVGGTNQTALVGYPTNLRPAVRVTDANGLGVPGEIVTFAVTGGGGSVTKAVDTTDANGVAQVGAWTVGGSAGANVMTATVASLAGSPVTFNADGITSQFNITIQYEGAAPSAQVQLAFDSAVAFWQRVIIGDIPDITGNFPQHPSCGLAAVNETVDDIKLVARFTSIDGPSNILAQAGTCFVRSTVAPWSIVGVMIFDTADLNTFVTSGRFEGVVRHEMGHIMGVGGAWNRTLSNASFPPFNCLQNAGGADPFFNCPRALAAFDSLGGASYTGGQRVPVENVGGPGSAGSHWREAIFDEELMTSQAENVGVPTPISILTIASLEDLLFTVNYGAAESYTQVFSVSALRAASARSSPYRDEVLRLPIMVMGPDGRVTRVILP